MHEHAELILEGLLAHWLVNGGGEAVGIGWFGEVVKVRQKDVAAAGRLERAR